MIDEAYSLFSQWPCKLSVGHPKNAYEKCPMTSIISTITFHKARVLGLGLYRDITNPELNVPKPVQTKPTDPGTNIYKVATWKIEITAIVHFEMKQCLNFYNTFLSIY